MHAPSHATAATLTAVVAVSLMASCGADEGPAVQAELTSTVELGGGVVAEISPGVVRDRDVDPPRLWASAPHFEITISTGPTDPEPAVLRLQNIAPDATATVSRAETVASGDVSGCPDETSRPIDCDNESDPACSEPTLTDVSGDASTSRDLSADLPACRRVIYDLRPPTPQNRPLRFAVVGATPNLDQLERILADIEDRSGAGSAVDWIVLTGDHAEQRSPGSLDSLESRLAERELPLMLLRGETERLRNDQGSFRPRFGPITIQFTVGNASFTSFDSATRALNGLSIESLNSRLDNGGSGPRIALTHTPLFDPDNLRDDGFRSALEASRILSVLSQTNTRLLLAGHAPTRGRLERGNVDMVTSSALDRPGYTLVTVPTSSDPETSVAVERVNL